MERPWCIPGLVEDGKTKQGRAKEGGNLVQLANLGTQIHMPSGMISEKQEEKKKALESRITRFRPAAISHVC